MYPFKFDTVTLIETGKIIYSLSNYIHSVASNVWHLNEERYQNIDLFFPFTIEISYK